jgi:hypothetical protein
MRGLVDYNVFFLSTLEFIIIIYGINLLSELEGRILISVLCVMYLLSQILLRLIGLKSIFNLTTFLDLAHRPDNTEYTILAHKFSIVIILLIWVIQLGIYFLIEARENRKME